MYNKEKEMRIREEEQTKNMLHSGSALNQSQIYERLD